MRSDAIKYAAVLGVSDSVVTGSRPLVSDLFVKSRNCFLRDPHCAGENATICTNVSKLGNKLSQRNFN